MKHGGILTLPPPYKMRKGVSGKGVISITPALLNDLFLEYRRRKAAERQLKFNQENLNPANSFPQEYFPRRVSNELLKTNLNIESDRTRLRKILKAQPRKNKEALHYSLEPNIPALTVQQETTPEVPVTLLHDDETAKPPLTAEIPVGYGAECEVEDTCEITDPNEAPFAASFEEIFDGESPFKLKLNVDGFLESLPKENVEKVEDEITKIKNMVPFLQELFSSTVSVAGKLLDKNLLMDTGRKRNANEFTTAGTFAKRLLGLTSALNRLETHLITSIECLQQSVHAQQFLPEAQNQPNFMESFIKMDPQCASDSYQQFLVTADSQINFTKTLHKSLKDNANINTQM